MAKSSKSDIPALFNAALVALNSGDIPKAEALFRRVIELDASHVPALNLVTVALMSLGRFADAEPFIARAVALNKGSDVSFYNYGLVARHLKKPQLAYDQFSAALALNPKERQTWNNRGIVNNDLGRHEAAIADFDQAIALDAGYAEAYANKGKALAQLKRHDEALDVFQRGLGVNGDFAEVIVASGDILVRLKRYDEALAAYDKALAIKPALAEAWIGCGNAFYLLRRLAEASAAYDRALSIQLASEMAWLGRGNVLTDRNQYDEALAAYDMALSIKPDLESAWLGRGNVFYMLKRPHEAFTAYDKALSIQPDLEGAWLGRANMLFDLRRYDEAFEAYDRCYTLDPDFITVEGHRFYSKLNCCNWTGWEAEQEQLLKSVRAGKCNSQPFVLLSVDATPHDQLQSADSWIGRNVQPTPYAGATDDLPMADKLRIGYLSTDFRTHPVGYLIANLFENHDRSRFETFGFSIGPNDKSELRGRIEKSFFRFVDLHNKSDEDVSKAIKSAGIDILVDLMGHSQGARLAVLARRPAPILAGYLGFAGTVGGNLLDYIVADGTVIPDGNEKYYAEKVVRLPNSVMPHDSQARAISDTAPTRKDQGLPEGAFVFCCFNNAHKINPAVFGSWMRILGKIDGSVMWLSNVNDVARNNLRAESVKRGIDPDRLVFSRFAPSPADHLARHRLADLFLDTLPYNAHTTASDALWAGLPVLTHAGETFAGRVAASLLNAHGLPELITRSREDYETRAFALAANREELEQIRRKLERNRLSTPLFDTAQLTRDLEAAYEAMYRRFRQQLSPDHIAVGPTTRP